MARRLPSRSKYRNLPITLDGVRFASKAEFRRWAELCLLVRIGEITNLRRQLRLPLTVDGVRIGYYVADFAYEDASGLLVIEDVKGVRTPLYRWKAKHVAAQYGTPVREIPAY